MAPASPDVAHHVKARGARVTASDGALLVTRGTSSVVLPATARRPPLRVLRPEFFASHGSAVALGRSEPTRGVELRWLTPGRGGTAGWRSALVSLDGPPCGVTHRTTRIASVAPEGQIRACVLRRDTVLVLRVAGDLTAHRLLGSSASVLVARFNDVAPFDAATTLTPVPGGAALLLKARSRNGGADVLYDVPLDADSEDESSGSGG
ncbi:hypothetical protein JL721_2993 [Aureococcus anophagefferens]|nr:hypothetical protein JL721_2993 [Aureococcus anophagefferens]